ncbi:MAG: AAA family ATPase [Myxococcota bacterium]
MVLRRIAKCTGLGRFDKLDHPAGHQFELRRLSLVYARNGAGKSTLARLLGAAGRADADDVLRDRRIGAAQAPEVVLELEEKERKFLKFNGTQWIGNSPRFLVFDRTFVEANVYVGRHQGKSQRKELLALALGPEHVAVQRAIKVLSDRARKVTEDRKPHHAVVAPAARDVGLSVDECLALKPLVDAEVAQRDVRALLDEATKADEIRKRPRPSSFPVPPELDPARLRGLLDTDGTSIGDDGKDLVEKHLRELGEHGERWVRYGLGVRKGTDCPFCTQDLSGVALIELYRRRFDAAYERLVDELAGQARLVEALKPWWEKVGNVGPNNVPAFGRWSDVEGVIRPAFGSAERKKDIDHVSSVATAALTQKRSHPLAVLPGPVDWREFETRWKAVRDAVVVYNEAIATANQRIDAFLAEVARQDPSQLRLELRRLEAAVRRHAPDVARAVSERARFDAERADIEVEKETVTGRLKFVQESRLPLFAQRVNELLADLCADFSIEALDSERVGGEAGMDYTLVVGSGRLPIRSGSEDRFARVLSDGDRSTIALAVFLTSIEDADLAQTIVVFDDPITSMDDARQLGTAERIVKLAFRAAQVVVLSHHERFVTRIAHDWARHVTPELKSDLVDLELEHGVPRLRRRRAEEPERTRLIRELQEFVDLRDDDQAEHFRGQIRILLESDCRRRWPHLFEAELATLEPVIRKLKGDPQLRLGAALSHDELEELDWLCAHGAGGNHPQAHRPIDPPDPVAVRGMARRALAWVAR